MAKAKQKYYAVHGGREGTQIYLTWDETKANVARVSNVKYKSFHSAAEAQAWLQGIVDAMAPTAPPHDPSASQEQSGYDAEQAQLQLRPRDPLYCDDRYDSGSSRSTPPARRTGAQRRGDPGPSSASHRAAERRRRQEVQQRRRQPQQSEGPQGIHMPSASALAGVGAPTGFDHENSIYVDSDSEAEVSAQVKTEGEEDYDDIEMLSGPPYDEDEDVKPKLENTEDVKPKLECFEDVYLSDDDIVMLDGPPDSMKAKSAVKREASASHDAFAAADDFVPFVATQAGPTPTPAPPPIVLSPEQQAVLQRVMAGENVFFTGSAGTGKSVLLREIIRVCGGRDGQAAGRLGVTASTGIASVNIGGCTLHSWAGIQLGKEDKDTLVAKIFSMTIKAWCRARDERRALRRKRNSGVPLTDEEVYIVNSDPMGGRKTKAVERWKKTKTLIIDEISMIDGKLFDKLEYIGREVRNNELPFGGLQLVLSGDFCQLPPVPDKTAHGAQVAACFAFDAEFWDRCVGAPILLRKVFRQKDQTFVDMLNAMRFGQIDATATLAFHKLEREVMYEDEIDPTELYPTRSEVEGANSSRLAKLSGRLRTFRAHDTPGKDKNGNVVPKDRVERALKDQIVPKDLPLKVGAQVMLVKNITQGLLVNGTLGRVTGFHTTREAKDIGIDVMLPDAREPAGGRANAAGRNAYEDGVATGEHARAQAEENEQRLKRILQTSQVWPAVQFLNGPQMLCVPLSFESVTADGSIEAIREQVPLILAWALSIHKSQGQTLERVRVNLGRTFEKGQAYVALSRATRMETLQVLNFDPSKVRAHPRVLQWMAQQTGEVVLPVKKRDEIEDDLEYWQEIL